MQLVPRRMRGRITDAFRAFLIGAFVLIVLFLIAVSFAIDAGYMYVRAEATNRFTDVVKGIHFARSTSGDDQTERK